VKTLTHQLPFALDDYAKPDNLSLTNLAERKENQKACRAGEVLASQYTIATPLLRRFPCIPQFICIFPICSFRCQRQNKKSIHKIVAEQVHSAASSLSTVPHSSAMLSIGSDEPSYSPSEPSQSMQSAVFHKTRKCEDAYQKPPHQPLQR
jgi:hypothetical protein